MRTFRAFLVAPLAIAALLAAPGATSLAQASGGSVAAGPAIAEKKPEVTVVHGDTLRDDYFWLREKANPAVLAHLDAENAYTAAMMAPTSGLQDRLYKE